MAVKIVSIYVMGNHCIIIVDVQHLGAAAWNKTNKLSCCWVTCLLRQCCISFPTHTHKHKFPRRPKSAVRVQIKFLIRIVSKMVAKCSSGPCGNTCDGDVQQGIETEIGLKVGGLGSRLCAAWELPILSTYPLLLIWMWVRSLLHPGFRIADI